MARNFIVIFSPEKDVHSLAVKRKIDELASGKVSTIIFDLAEFPVNSEISVKPSGWELRVEDSVILTSDNIRSIWWRRPGRHKIHEHVIDAGARKFAENEAMHAFDAIVYWPGEYLMVNPVGCEMIANRKAIQLATAVRLGLRVPSTLITNSPNNAIGFADALCNGAIYKTLTAPISVFGETRRFSRALEGMVSTISLAPVIFQEEINKRRDIRVTIIGEKIFSSWIEVRNPNGRKFPDWRLDVTARAHKIELPSDLVCKLRSLMREFGLVYGAIDLIENNEGEYYFLEINPSGQFLFNEVDTGEEMALAFAQMLLRE